MAQRSTSVRLAVPMSKTRLTGPDPVERKQVTDQDEEVARCTMTVEWERHFDNWFSHIVSTSGLPRPSSAR